MLTTKEASKILFRSSHAVRSYIHIGLGKKDQKEKLQANQVMNGARLEYRIKLDDLEAYRKKWFTIIV